MASLFPFKKVAACVIVHYAFFKEVLRLANINLRENATKLSLIIFHQLGRLVLVPFVQLSIPLVLGRLGGQLENGPGNAQAKVCERSTLEEFEVCIDDNCLSMPLFTNC